MKSTRAKTSTRAETPAAAAAPARAGANQTKPEPSKPSTDFDPSAVARRIKFAREMRGYGVNELDRKVGVAQGTTSRIERGVRPTVRGMTIGTLFDYARALHLRPEWLLTERAPMDAAGALSVEETSDAFDLARRICIDGGVSLLAIENAAELPIEHRERVTTLEWIKIILVREQALVQEGRIKR